MKKSEKEQYGFISIRCPNKEKVSELRKLIATLTPRSSKSYDTVIAALRVYEKMELSPETTEKFLATKKHLSEKMNVDLTADQVMHLILNEYILEKNI